MIKVNFILGLLIFCQFGCAINKKKYKNQDFIISEDDFEKKPSNFSNKNLNSDVQILLHFFQNGYSGYEFIERKVIKDIEKKIKRLSSSSINNWLGLCANIATIFDKVPDAHLQAHYQENCLPLELRAKRISRVGENVALRYSKKPFKTIYKKLNGITYGILGIKYFPSFDDPKWSGFELEMKKIKKVSIMIIDLRQNSGGDDSRGMQLAAFLNGNEIIKSHYAMDYERTNPETYI